MTYGVVGVDVGALAAVKALLPQGLGGWRQWDSDQQRPRDGYREKDDYSQGRSTRTRQGLKRVTPLE